MGIGLMSNCSVYPETSNVIAPNPDPLNFSILMQTEMGNNVMAIIHYPDCTNYDGTKVLIFENMSTCRLRSLVEIDPHFSESENSPIARFMPTVSGIRHANKFLRSIS